MKFIDQTEITVHAGNGGNGMVSFASSKGRPKLGPDGGDGGHGGDVIFVGDNGLNTLGSLRFRQHYRAEDGAKGGTQGCTGRCGTALKIPVPVGTVVIDQATEQVLGEVLDADDELLIARGGERGRGNMRFVRSTHQAPTEFTEGAPGEIRDLSLELKLLADVGFAGLPNAGKSTLLSRVSAARPKVADYPFTTLTPQLGVVNVGEHWENRSFVAADIPGLIEGASQGKGLGHAFLRHLERTRVICYVIDVFGDTDALDTFRTLQHELSSFNRELGQRHHVIALNKIDLFADEDGAAQVAEVKARFSNQGCRDVHLISGVSGAGIDGLIKRLYELL